METRSSARSRNNKSFHELPMKENIKPRKTLNIEIGKCNRDVHLKRESLDAQIARFDDVQQATNIYSPIHTKRFFDASYHQLVNGDIKIKNINKENEQIQSKIADAKNAIMHMKEDRKNISKIMDQIKEESKKVDCLHGKIEEKENILRMLLQ